MNEIKFLKDCYIEVCVGFDKSGHPIMEEEKISKGEKFDVELFDTMDFSVMQVQFGDGSVCFIDCSLFEII